LLAVTVSQGTATRRVRRPPLAPAVTSKVAVALVEKVVFAEATLTMADFGVCGVMMELAVPDIEGS
jgi:hypothetical protein